MSRIDDSSRQSAQIPDQTPISRTDALNSKLSSLTRSQAVNNALLATASLFTSILPDAAQSLRNRFRAPLNLQDFKPDLLSDPNIKPEEKIKQCKLHILNQLDDLKQQQFETLIRNFPVNKNSIEDDISKLITSLQIQALVAIDNPLNS